MGIADAKVSSVRELSSAEKKSLEQKLAAITGKIVRATYSARSQSARWRFGARGQHNLRRISAWPLAAYAAGTGDGVGEIGKWVIW